MHTVAVDASVLINFLLLNRVDILGALSEYCFVVSDAVHKEITRPDQQILLSDALDAKLLQRQEGTDPNKLRIFAALTEVMGVGEAACLAAAEHRGWLLASDERGVFFRMARERIGEHRILTTPEILLYCCGQSELELLLSSKPTTYSSNPNRHESNATARLKHCPIFTVHSLILG